MKQPSIYLQHIIDAIEDVREFTANGERDKKTKASVMYKIEVMGEAANRLPEAFREQHPHIPWRNMIDMRNALIHGYDSVKEEILWDVIDDELDPIHSSISAILKQEKGGE